MERVDNIRRMDMFNAGPIFKLKISRTDGSVEDIGFLTCTKEGQDKLEALQDFIRLNHLEEKCFLISQ